MEKQGDVSEFDFSCFKDRILKGGRGFAIR